MKLVPEIDGYLAGVEKIGAAVLESAKKLKVIGRNGIGVDNIDLETAERLGIKICPTPGANARGVAELAVALLFSLLRAVPYSDSRLKSRSWERKKGIEAEGKTVGLVGCGNIGKKVASMASALGMKVLASDPYPDGSFCPPNFAWSSFEEVLSRSDILSLHCPAGDRPLIDGAAVSRMKEGAYLINTARAALIDEKAVIAGLENGRIAGYGTDVFPEEPPADYTLIRHEAVIATPHVGGYTEESVDRATTGAIEQILENI
jgi:phosphoglycerate dehydrogenase-like enzyme